MLRGANYDRWSLKVVVNEKIEYFKKIPKNSVKGTRIVYELDGKGTPTHPKNSLPPLSDVSNSFLQILVSLYFNVLQGMSYRFPK